MPSDRAHVGREKIFRDVAQMIAASRVHLPGYTSFGCSLWVRPGETQAHHKCIAGYAGKTIPFTKESSSSGE